MLVAVDVALRVATSWIEARMREIGDEVPISVAAIVNGFENASKRSTVDVEVVPLNERFVFAFIDVGVSNPDIGVCDTGCCVPVCVRVCWSGVWYALCSGCCCCWLIGCCCVGSCGGGGGGGVLIARRICS